MPTYTLKYFDVRARGEIIRLLFSYKGVQFKDERFSQESWPAEKQKIKFGQLPVLEKDGKLLTESSAIERYLAREFGMYGCNNEEAYEIDQVVCICVDLFEKFGKQVFEKDPKKKEELATALKTGDIPKYMGNIEELLKGKEKGFLVGKKLSYGDLAIFNIVDGKISDEILQKFPRVLAVVNNVKGNPKIQKYLEQRKKTDI